MRVKTSRGCWTNARRVCDKPLAMSDALSSNEVADESRLMRCHCLAHGRRKFSDLAEMFPHECQVVLEVLSAVFDHDEQTRKEQLSPEARLAYHQAQSRPLMDGLQRWLDTADRRSSGGTQQLAWGKPLAYMQAPLGDPHTIFIGARRAARQ